MFHPNNSKNFSASTMPLPSEYCRRFQDEEYHTVNFLVTLVCIILYALICPLIILMNVLVIVAVKTRRRLQSTSNILLACLAGTDLLVGTVSLPASIVAEIFAIADGSVTTYCNITNNMASPLSFFSVFASFLHLAVVSVDRYIALKYSLQYEDIVTKFRITIAVAVAWFIAGVYTILRALVVSSLISFVIRCIMILVLLLIAYCHVSLFFVTRRHEKQIRSKQTPGEGAAKFREEKKAWKTTTIIIGCAFLCVLPGYFVNLAVTTFTLHPKWTDILRPLVYFSFMGNSLCNPIVYCFRSTNMRRAMIAFLKRQESNNSGPPNSSFQLNSSSQVHNSLRSTRVNEV